MSVVTLHDFNKIFLIFLFFASARLFLLKFSWKYPISQITKHIHQEQKKHQLKNKILQKIKACYAPQYLEIDFVQALQN